MKHLSRRAVELLIGVGFLGCAGSTVLCLARKDTRQGGSAGQDAGEAFEGGRIDEPDAAALDASDASVSSAADGGPQSQEVHVAGTTDGCAAGRVRINGGTFVPGGKRNPQYIKPFCMDRTEVTAEAYGRCVLAGACNEPEHDEGCNGSVAGRELHPINCVTHGNAAAYCTWSQSRLPTDAEWQWAARGRNAATRYPWGNEDPTNQLCWSKPVPRTGTCPVGSYPAGDSPDGVSDLSGNVNEWMSTRGPPRYETYVIRGGYWFDDNPGLVRPGTISWDNPETANHAIGFRCVADMKKP